LFGGFAGAFVGGLVLAGAAGAVAWRLLTGAFFAAAGVVAALIALRVVLALALAAGGWFGGVAFVFAGGLLLPLVGRLCIGLAFGGGLAWFGSPVR
jgi:hypothetical protein